ncbi:MAG: hypothetical protein QM770_08775 [Tepidisphaeraceae bacterium]
MLWPAQLTIDYGRSPVMLTQKPFWWLTTIVTLLLVSVIALICRRARSLRPALGPAIFVIGFAPNAGLTTFQMQMWTTVTDHYLYFSMIGVAIVVADLLELAGRRNITLQRGLATAMGVALVALVVRNFVAQAMWRTSAALFTHAIDVTPWSSVAWNNLGADQLQAGQMEEGLASVRKAQTLRPRYLTAIENEVSALVMLRRFDDAERRMDDLEQMYNVEPYMDPAQNARVRLKYINACLQYGGRDYAKRGIDRFVRDAHLYRALRLMAEIAALRASGRLGAATQQSSPTTLPRLTN